RLSANVLIHHHAVDQIKIVERLRAVNDELIVWAGIGHAWGEQHASLNGAIDWQRLDRFRIEVRRDLRGLENRWRGSGHGDRLTHPADSELGIDSRRLCEFQRGSLRGLLHPFQLEAYGVWAGRKGGKVVIAVSAGDGRACALQIRR